MAVVEFVPADFRELYPQFTEALITDGQLTQAFNVACLLLDNSDSSPVPYDPTTGVLVRQTLLNLLVCHLATLALWPLGQSGPVSSSSEGSVSVSFGLPTRPDGVYFRQTPCGQAYWQAIQVYIRGGRYYPVNHYHPWG